MSRGKKTILPDFANILPAILNHLKFFLPTALVSGVV
jgi:hypothetical protein